MALWQYLMERDTAAAVTQTFNRQLAIDAVRTYIKDRTNLWHWLFICRRQLYRDRIYHGLRRDPHLNVIRDEEGNIEFLEKPYVGTRLFGLNDPILYQGLLLDRLHPMYQEFIMMLGNGDEEKGKEVLKQKLLKEEYVLSTEAVEYARARIFSELESGAAFLEEKLADYEGKGDFDLRLPVTDLYFELEMKRKIDKDYEDKLADARLGKQRITNWKKDEWDRDRAKIQIDFYCKEWIEENGPDRFVLFDHVSEDVIKPTDFKALLTRYSPFIPKHKDLYYKYEVALWGSGTKNTGGDGLN